MTPLVSVLMPAYNHEKYISKAIESVLNQKTSFNFELLINDDKSTDNTRKIIKKYETQFPKIIRVVYQEKNQGLIRSYKTLLDIAKGKYISILESDDFWTDESKLEKQIDFFEKNPDYGLSATACNHVNENDEITLVRIEDNLQKTNNWYDILIENNILVAATVCFRKSVFDKYCNMDDYIELNFKTFDYAVWLSIAKNSKSKYFPYNTAAYRVLYSSISNTNNYKKQMNWEKECCKILSYIITKYGSGSFSLKEINNIIIYRYIRRTLKNKRIFEYIFYSHFIQITNFKTLFRKFFPITYYLQRKARNKNI